MVYPCDQCDASFPVRKSMLNHKRLKHGDTKQFNCEKCVYTSNKKENLQQHVRSQHEKIKEICETCGKNFTDKPTLNAHIKKFHPEQIKRKPTENLETQSKRIKMDADSDEKGNDDDVGNEKINNEFKCSICDKQFKELYNLNKHIKNVHEEKSLKCNNCSYKTNDTPSMQRHVDSCKKEEERKM